MQNKLTSDYFKEPKRTPTVEEIAAFLYEMVKDDLPQIKDPKFSFYRYLDMKLAVPQYSASGTDSMPSVSTPVPNSDPSPSPASTPKFVGSEDNTQTKTNYYTEPSIGMLSPQPKRNKLPSPPHVEPIDDSSIQYPVDPIINNPDNLDEDQLFQETVINASIFADEKPHAMDPAPVSTPTIGAHMVPSPEAPIVKPPSQSQPPFNTKPQDLPTVPTERKESTPRKFEPMEDKREIKRSPPTPIRDQRINGPSKKSAYYLEGVKCNNGSSGIYIYVTTEKPQTVPLSTKVSIPLPLNESNKVRKEKVKKIAEASEAEFKQANNEKKYVGFCTKIISRLNFAEKASAEEVIKYIIYTGRLITKMKEQARSTILTECAKGLVPIFIEYMATVAVTFQGNYADLLRKIFKRGEILVKLEMLNLQSGLNLDYIESSLANPSQIIEAKERLKQERKRVKNEQKLFEISKEIRTIAKKECEEKYKDTVCKWCKSRPIKNSIKSIYEFLQSIQGIASSSSATK